MNIEEEVGQAKPSTSNVKMRKMGVTHLHGQFGSLEELELTP